MTAVKRPKSLRAARETSQKRPALHIHALAAACAASPLLTTTLAGAETAPVVFAAAPAQPIIITGRRTSPYTDPQAPYKADRSASQKLTQPLLDVSKSVSVIPSAVIEDLGATSLRDLMRTQPGVTLGTGEGGNAFGDRIFIRGFDARGDVFVDGVRDPGVGSRETFALEQIEILKGPSSTFGGHGTTGGAVSLISKAPQDGNIGVVKGVLGTDQMRRTTLDLNRKLGDQLLVRVNTMAQYAAVPGRNSVTGSRWGAALALAYQPSEALQLAFDYYHLSTDEMPDWGVPVDITHNQPFQVDRNNFYGILARDYRTTFADIYTAKASHRRSEHASIRSLVRYGETANAYTASAPEQPALTNPDPALWTVRANAKRRDAVAAYWVSQTDATIDFHALGTEHALVFGAEVSREELLNRGRAFIECATLPCTGTSTSPVHNLFDPNPAMPWTVTDNGITSRTNFLVREAAAYTIDTIKFGPHWELLGGVRYDDYRINLRLLTISTGALSLRENHSKFWNWHVGVTYKPLPNGTLYAAYGSSSNPSGEALDATALDYGGLDPRTADLSPEHNRSFEIGTKWNVFDEHLNLTAALFRIEKSNARVALNSTTVALVGEQRADGFELGASGNITPDWSLFGGLALLDAKIVSSPLAATVGARFPNVPKASFTLMTRYEISQRLYLGATTNYNGRKFGGTVAAGTTQVPGYWRLDFFGGYRVSDSISLSFNVLNVTDEVYYDALYRSATPFVYIAPGRSAFVELEYEF